MVEVSPVQLVPGKTDQDYAQELIDKLIVLWMPICELADKATEDGFRFNVGIGQGPFGKHQISLCEVMKVFKPKKVI